LDALAQLLPKRLTFLLLQFAQSEEPMSPNGPSQKGSR
jgi:hypothetical protein